jgi:hypothetical protein
MGCRKKTNKKPIQRKSTRKSTHTHQTPVIHHGDVTANISGAPLEHGDATDTKVVCRGPVRSFFSRQRACNKKRFEYKKCARRARMANLDARRERRQKYGGTTKDPVSANPMSFRDTALCDVMHYFDMRLRQLDITNGDGPRTSLQDAYRCAVIERWGLFCCSHTLLMANPDPTDVPGADARHNKPSASGSAGVLTRYFTPQPTKHEVHRKLIRDCRRDVWMEVQTSPSVDELTPEHCTDDGTCRTCYMPGMTRTRFEWVCTSCGSTSSYADPKDRHFKETDQCNPPSTGYDRKNHLNEWLARIQASERKMIPPDVMESVESKFIRWGVPQSNATYRTVRQFLKDGNHQKYFEHIPQIICFLTRKRPIPIEEAKIKHIRSIFKNLQGPFDKLKPKGRKNFLSYSFVLYKIFELLDLDEYMPYFPMLKSRSNLIKADTLWKRLCRECNYEFIPTV